MANSRTGRLMTTFACVLAIIIVEISAEKEKRQIFREQVTPAKGGKIPEEAFRADRLALNRLNKEGITVPDGIVLEARNVPKHAHHENAMSEVLKVFLTPDGRYVPPEGRYHYENKKSVDTTYRLRGPVDSGKHQEFSRPATGQLPTTRNPYYKINRKPLIYEPLPGSLVIPTSHNFIHDTFYPAWNYDYSWDFSFSPFDDIFVNNLPIFNSHQVIDDYDRFFDNFHNRRLRHVSETNTDDIFTARIIARKNSES